MHQRYGVGGAAVADFKTMIGAVDAGLAEAQRVDEKTLRFPDFADGQHGAVEAARGDVRS